MLSIKNINKKFGARRILHDVSIDVKDGEIGILLGASGVGKSTLLRILNNLETMDSGAVLLDGKELDLTQVNKTHIVGMVFQNFNLFEHLTVEQNITLPLEKTASNSKKKAREIAGILLSNYGLADKATMYVSQLSGGQRQRLALARTLALHPKVVCLDEPTSALDPLLTSYVARNIQNLAEKNYIVLVSTHDTMLLEKLKNGVIHLMKNGSIVEIARISDFYANKDAYPHIKEFVLGILPEHEEA